MTVIVFEVMFDGGCLGNGAEGAQMYGSYAIRGTTHETMVFHSEFPGGGVPHTNNTAEYLAALEAVSALMGLLADRPPREFGVRLMTDSQLVVGQMAEGWKVRLPHLARLKAELSRLLGEFGHVEWVKVPREEVVSILGH